MKNLIALLGKIFVFAIAKLPMRLQMFLGDCIGILWFDIIRLRRNIVLSNLNIAFPNLTQKERVRIGRASVCNLGRGLIEFSRIPFLKKNKHNKDLFIIEGLEHLQAAQKANKGVCLLTLHLGNPDWATAGLAIHDIQVTIISKLFSIQWINDIWFASRKSLGTKFIPPRNSSYAILRALKNKEIVVFVQDQFMGPPRGFKTTFFGKTTGTAGGLSVIASRAKTPIVPIYTYRLEDGRHRLKFLPEIEFEYGPDKEQNLVNLTQKCNDIIEQIVREHPEQWMWVHKRWKHYQG